MKKRFLPALITISIIATFIMATPVSVSAFSGGGGTASDPYIITNQTELASMANYLSSYFKLANDINLSGYWTPVGSSIATKVFKGSLDGNNKTINNLNISSSTDYTGLFGFVSNATVKNLTINNGTVNSTGDYTGSIIGHVKDTLNMSNCKSNVTVNGKSYSGGFVGYGQHAAISNCTYTGIVSGTSYVGGIVGRVYKSTTALPTAEITNCQVIKPNAGAAGLRVAGTAASVGGIAGEFTGVINACYTNINVTGGSRVGGIAGCLQYYNSTSGTIRNCYATGDITAADIGSVGGIAGITSATTSSTSNYVENCYATGSVYNIRNQNTGGIVGNNGTSTTYSSINNCFALNYGVVQEIKNTSTNYIGLINGNVSYSSSNYYLNTAYIRVGTTSYSGSTTFAGSNGTAITQQQAELKSTYTNAGWNFNSIWIMDSRVSKYPILQWLYVAPPPTVEISCDSDKSEFEVGDVFTLTAVLSDPNDSVKQWNYDPDIFTAVRNGNSAVFTCNKDCTDTVDIEVITVKGAQSSISIAKIKKVMPTIRDFTLTIGLEVGDTCNLAGLDDYNVKMDMSGAVWTSGDSDIVSVNQKGKVTARNLGVTFVTVIQGSRQSSIKILVYEQEKTDVKINEPAKTQLLTGETLQLHAAITSGDEDTPITWSSSPSGIVSISENGLVTANKLGTVKIYAIAGGAVSEPVTVNVIANEPVVLAAWGNGISGDFEYINQYKAIDGIYKFTETEQDHAYIDAIGVKLVKTNSNNMKATNWLDSTPESPKAWQAVLPAGNCTSFSFDFETKCSTSQVPAYFIMQYSTNGIDWTDIDEYRVIPTSTTLYKDNGFSVPAGTEKVYIRWMCTSDYTKNDVLFTSAADNIIMNVVVRGYAEE